MIERGHPLFADSSRASSEIPEWLQEFREILVDDEVPEHLSEDQNYKGPVQKTHWRSRTSCRKFW